MELASHIGLPCRECNLEPYDVMTADEAFFTATTFSILPVTRFNAHPVGAGEVGANTRRLTQAWSEMVGVDIIEQALDYSGRSRT